VFEYVIGGVIYSAFTCWYLFWPGALLLGLGIRWLRKETRARKKDANPHRWRSRRLASGSAAPAAASSEAGRVVTLRRASLALLAVAPLLLVARILLTPGEAVDWFDFDSFDEWPNWFTSGALVVLPWAQVGVAALVIVARRGTRRVSACVAVGSVLLLFAFAQDLLLHPGTMDELGFPH
jgi:hypothetical protein